MDEKEWLLKPPNNWKSEKVVDALLKIESDDTDSIGEALASLDEYVAGLEKRIAELKGELESESNWADHYFSEWQKAIGSEYSKRPRS